MKNPLTPAAIEPATFRLLAQYLKYCATAVPQLFCIYQKSTDYRNILKLPRVSVDVVEANLPFQ